jgi:hypothetical protein
MPPLRQNPGEFLIESAESALPNRIRQQIPGWAETAAAQGIGFDYGVAFGALYGALRPSGGPVLVDGLVLGLGTWATGYLGWLPALGLMPPVYRQEPLQVFGTVARHAAYGVATVAVYDWLRERADGATWDSRF